MAISTGQDTLDILKRDTQDILKIDTLDMLKRDTQDILKMDTLDILKTDTRDILRIDSWPVDIACIRLIACIPATPNLRAAAWLLEPSQ